MTRRLLEAGSIAAALLLVAAVTADDFADREEAAEVVADQLLFHMNETLKRRLEAGSAFEAIDIYTDTAPMIANELSSQTGWRITRVGTRTRNPMRGMPDPWEQRVLADFAARGSRGESFLDMTHAEVVDEPAGKYFRFMKAIEVRPECLTCHGNQGEIPVLIYGVIKNRYPHDQAIDYKAGELRGAVSIKQPMGQGSHFDDAQSERTALH
ncbi:MAG: Tll0287-like domain-containing protein [Gammaproteobacteria bacterium]